MQVFYDITGSKTAKIPVFTMLKSLNIVQNAQRIMKNGIVLMQNAESPRKTDKSRCGTHKKRVSMLSAAHKRLMSGLREGFTADSGNTFGPAGVLAFAVGI